MPGAVAGATLMARDLLDEETDDPDDDHGGHDNHDDHEQRAAA
jgi:CysZ protein